MWRIQKQHEYDERVVDWKGIQTLRTRKNGRISMKLIKYCVMKPLAHQSFIYENSDRSLPNYWAISPNPIPLHLHLYLHSLRTSVKYILSGCNHYVTCAATNISRVPLIHLCVAAHTQFTLRQVHNSAEGSTLKVYIP